MTPIKTLKSKIIVLEHFYTLMFGLLLTVMYLSKVRPLILIVLGILSLINYYWVMKNMSNNNIFMRGYFFKKKYEKIAYKWLSKYINSSKSLQEKEYRLMFLGLLVDHKNLQSLSRLRSFISMNYDMINRSKNIESYVNGPQRPLFMLESKRSVSQIDTNNDENMELVKSIYKEFQDVGLLGLYFYKFDSLAFSLLAKLQPDTLTQYDKINMKKMIPYMESLEFDMNNHMDLKLKIEKISVLKNFILNDKNLDNLDLYKQFCTAMFKLDPKTQQDMLSSIDRKLNYMHLDKTLSVKAENKNMHKI